MLSSVMGSLCHLRAIWIKHKPIFYIQEQNAALARAALKAIASRVATGSFIEIHSEDREQWRSIFDKDDCAEVKPY